MVLFELQEITANKTVRSTMQHSCYSYVFSYLGYKKALVHTPYFDAYTRAFYGGATLLPFSLASEGFFSYYDSMVPTFHLNVDEVIIGRFEWKSSEEF